MTAPSIFLTVEEVAKLTGIRRGKDGISRNMLQVQQLGVLKVPHYINAAGEPVVARAVIEGGTRPAANESWEPAVRKTK